MEHKLTFNESPNGLCIGVESLTQRHKVLRFLNNVFSISAKNVFNFFIGNFSLLLCFTCQKGMCYVSLEFPALKIRQDSTLIAQKVAMGMIGIINASVVMIKIKNRTISTIYYFCNTNQNI